MVKEVLVKSEARAVPSAFVGEGAALCQAKGISAATGRTRLGRGVSTVDWTTAFDSIAQPNADNAAVSAGDTIIVAFSAETDKANLPDTLTKAQVRILLQGWRVWIYGLRD